MYEAHFGLATNPFSPAPAPEFIYESKEYQEALAHFRYAIANREAFLLLTGEVGTGKTTAIQALRRQLPPQAPIAVVTHTTLEPKELLEEIALKFGLEPVTGESKPALMHRLEAFLRDRQRGGSPAMLVLDEAHLLAPRLLEEVRLLSNLEAETGKLLQICLVGQPELEAHLQQPELRQIRQRISVRYALRPLNAVETREYILHRLRAAGASDPESLFPEDASAAVHQLTQGIPREINVLAGQSLLNAYLADASSVSRAHAYAAKSDYGFEGVVAGPSPLLDPRAQAPAAPARPAPAPPVPRKLPTQAPPPPPRLVERPAIEDDEPEPEPVVEPERAAAPAARRPIPLPPASLRPTPGPAAAGSPPSAAVDAKPRVQFSGGPGTLYQGASRKGGGSRSLWPAIVVLLVLAVLVAFVLLQREGGPLDTLFRSTPDETTASDPARTGTANPSVDVAPEAVSQPPATPPPAQATAQSAAPETPPATVESQAASPQEPVSAPPQTEAATAPVQTPAQAVAEEAPTGFVAIQVASFRTRERAEQVLAEVTTRTGLKGVIQPSDVGGVSWQRILLGAFSSEEEATAAAEPLLRGRIIREVVVRPVPESLLGDLRP